MKIIVKESPVHGLGVFAAVDLAAGDTLEPVSYTHLTLPTILLV